MLGRHSHLKGDVFAKRNLESKRNLGSSRLLLPVIRETWLKVPEEAASYPAHTARGPRSPHSTAVLSSSSSQPLQCAHPLPPVGLRGRTRGGAVLGKCRGQGQEGDPLRRWLTQLGKVTCGTTWSILSQMCGFSEWNRCLTEGPECSPVLHKVHLPAHKHWASAQVGDLQVYLHSGTPENPLGN